jgi:hypothetical protein
MSMPPCVLEYDRLAASALKPLSCNTAVPNDRSTDNCSFEPDVARARAASAALPPAAAPQRRSPTMMVALKPSVIRLSFRFDSRQKIPFEEVAKKLDISINTVLTYVRRIYKKLHVNSRHAAVDRFKKMR